MFRGKNYKASVASFDKSANYEPAEAMKIVVDTAKAKFDETIELHVKLGVDSRHADQRVKPLKFWLSQKAKKPTRRRLQAQISWAPKI